LTKVDRDLSIALSQRMLEPFIFEGLHFAIACAGPWKTGGCESHLTLLCRS